MLCLGYDLSLKARPLAAGVDTSPLDAVAGLTPTERLDHALASRGWPT